MRITVEVTQAELEEMGLCAYELKYGMYDKLDAHNTENYQEYVGYNIYIKVVEKEVI